MCCTHPAENTGRKKSPSAHHRTILLGYICATKDVSTVGKNLLNSNTCPHNMVNIGPLKADIGLGVWGTSANFNGFCVFASLLHRYRSVEVNQTLHYVWPSPGLLHYIYIFGGCCLLTEFCPVQNSVCILLYWLPALLYDTRAVGVSRSLWRGIFMRQGGHPVRHWAVKLCSCLGFNLYVYELLKVNFGVLILLSNYKTNNVYCIIEAVFIACRHSHFKTMQKQ